MLLNVAHNRKFDQKWSSAIQLPLSTLSDFLFFGNSIFDLSLGVAELFSKMGSKLSLSFWSELSYQNIFYLFFIFIYLFIFFLFYLFFFSLIYLFFIFIYLFIYLFYFFYLFIYLFIIFFLYVNRMCMWVCLSWVCTLLYVSMDGVCV